MFRAGLTPVDTAGRWMGGRYYLQHLVRCIAALPASSRIDLVDLYWNAVPSTDPFEEVRALLDAPRVIRFPDSATGRLARKARRVLRGIRDARDLFDHIDITFTLPLIEHQGIPYVYWLPDFQHEHLRALYDEQHYQDIVTLYANYVASAARIVVSSEFGLRDFARFFPERAGDADVLRFCSVPDADWWALDPREVCDAAGLTQPFFVLSNQFTEHKNHLVVIEAIRILRDRGTHVTLACTGSDYDFRGMNYFARVKEYVHAHGLEAQVFFLGLLPRAQQMAITRRAVAALQPSRFEGWSTIIEDAKAIGKYVIASEFPVHREQLEGRSATFVDPQDAEGWAEALAAVGAVRQPGPHLDEEEAARPLLQKAMRECGETFVAIARKAAR